MKTELPCAIVRDLLPSYVEHLTEEETSAAVREHLEQCESCKKRYEAMTEEASLPAPEEQKSEAKEVDYLKTIRKNNRKKIFAAVILAIVLVLGAVCAKLFLIGTEADAESISTTVTPFPELNSIAISFLNIDSATVLTDIRIQTTGDVIDITGRKVLVSPIHPAEENSVSLNLAGITEVRAFGEPIWKNGIMINGRTLNLMRYKTEYVGSAPAVNKLISNMDLDAPHTLELQTAREPYGVTIHFTNEIREDRRFMIEGNACLLLALVDNLGEVYWDDPSGYTGSMTLKDAEAMVSERIGAYSQSHGTELTPPGSIKEYGADAYLLQVLSDILGV